MPVVYMNALYISLIDWHHFLLECGVLGIQCSVVFRHSVFSVQMWGVEWDIHFMSNKNIPRDSSSKTCLQKDRTLYTISSFTNAVRACSDTWHCIGHLCVTFRGHMWHLYVKWPIWAHNYLTFLPKIIFIQGGPERMQRLWSLISRTSSIKQNWFLFYYVENSFSNKMKPWSLILGKASES